MERIEAPRFCRWGKKKGGHPWQGLSCTNSLTGLRGGSKLGKGGLRWKISELDEGNCAALTASKHKEGNINSNV